MTETKWTPPPWRHLRPKSGVVGRYENDNYGSVEVARTGDFSDPEIKPFNEGRWIADANLIAAAPELYDELSNLFSRIYPDDNGGNLVHVTDSQYKSISQLLAKARGETGIERSGTG